MTILRRHLQHLYTWCWRHPQTVVRLIGSMAVILLLQLGQRAAVGFNDPESGLIFFCAALIVACAAFGVEIKPED